MTGDLGRVRSEIRKIEPDGPKLCAEDALADREAGDIAGETDREGESGDNQGLSRCNGSTVWKGGEGRPDHPRRVFGGHGSDAEGPSRTVANSRPMIDDAVGSNSARCLGVMLFQLLTWQATTAVPSPIEVAIAKATVRQVERWVCSLVHSALTGRRKGCAAGTGSVMECGGHVGLLTRHQRGRWS
jgi:hypothetical protein